MTFSVTQRATLAIVPKVTSSLSILGSVWIMLDVIGDKSKRNKLYHRLLFGLSLIDSVTSCCFFAATWPIPKDAPNVIWALGNDTSCQIQAFVLQMTCAAFIYNAILTIYFVLVVRFSFKETTLKKFEPLFHVLPISFGIATAVTCLVKGYFANSNLWCWIGGFENAYIYRWAFFYAPLWFCFLVVLVGMVMVFCGVRMKEQQTAEMDSHWKTHRSIVRRGSPGFGHDSFGTLSNSHASRDPLSLAGADEPTRQKSIRRLISLSPLHPPDRQMAPEPQLNQTKRTRQVATQSFFYILAFYLTYFFATVNRLYQQVEGKSLYILLLLHVIFQPLQGLYNFLIYRRPAVLKARRDHPDWSWCQVICSSLKLSVFKQSRRSSLTSADENMVAMHFGNNASSSSLTKPRFPQEEEGGQCDVERPRNTLQRALPSCLDLEEEGDVSTSSNGDPLESSDSKNARFS